MLPSSSSVVSMRADPRLVTWDELSESLWVAVSLERPATVGRDHVEALLAALSVEERATYHVRSTGSARETLLVGRALTRLVVGGVVETAPADLELVTGEHGKPHLSPRTFQRIPVHFNLSHCATHYLLVLSVHAAVGVDVETLRSYPPRLPSRFFRPAEIEALESLAPELRRSAFFHLWVIKEACVKAQGQRLAPGLRSVEASLDPSGRHRSLSWEIVDVDLRVKAAIALDPAPQKDLPTRLISAHLDALLVLP